ncbi:MULTISPECIES: nitroreductase [Streptomyces]|uniref:Acg family FMN-binding oxidoreductase n=1 Tax=Streptomyces TaxID=1883 RepID=UPI0004C6993E|nr:MULTISPECIES: nitroreductase [Streptomyces]RPK80135.1 Putative NAD(P)H nitroreductase [Streptomyces sp. ADI98-10]
MPTIEQRVTAVVPSLVEEAVTAPSMHNAQPWKFVHRPGTRLLSLYGDPDRALPIGDPDNRNLHIGCGAALLNLRVAAAHRGWNTVARLLPDRRDPWRLADVVLEESETTDHLLADLHPAVRLRHTSRSPFSDEAAAPEILDELSTAALLEGARLVVPGVWHADAVLDLVHDAELFESANDAMRAEIATWTRTGRAGEGPDTDGIPSYAFGPRQHDVTAPVRDFDVPRGSRDRASTNFEERPQIALLGTETDLPADWLRAGQAMERVLLQATLDGLATSVISQPLEWPELRHLTRDPNSRMGFVQMIIRFGYGPSGQVTPRRQVTEVLDIA